MHDACKQHIPVSYLSSLRVYGKPMRHKPRKVLNRCHNSSEMYEHYRKSQNDIN